MKKRMLCLISAVFLLLSLMPFNVWAATTIANVDMIITHPTHLATVDDFLQIYGGGCRLDTSVNSDGHRSGVRWSSVYSGKILNSADTFVGGELYELSVWLIADSGYAFDPSQTAVTVNMEKASMTVTDADHAQVTIQLIADNLYIHDVEVTGLDTPKAGASPDYSVTLHETTCLLTASGYDTCKNGVTWYDATDCKYLPVGTNFQSGHEYWAEIHIRANPGYAFPDNAQGYVNGTWIEASGVGDVIVLLMEFAPISSHTPSGWRTTQVYHYRVCTTCGEMLEQEDHTGGIATCAEKGICTVCGYEYIETTEDHTPDTSKWIARNDMYHYHGCILCGAHCDIEDHVAGPAGTPDAAVVCRDCGYTLEPAKNHVHDLSKIPQVLPTCTEGGNIEYYVCTGCMDCFTDPDGKNKIPDTMSIMVGAVGHATFEDWKYDKDHHWRICTVCNEVLIETKMVHEMENGKCTTCSYGDAAPEETESTAHDADTPEEAPAETTKRHREENARSGLPWWALLLLGLLALGIGIGGGVLMLTRKEK